MAGALPETMILPPRTVCGAGKAALLLRMCGEYGARGVVYHGRALRPGALGAAPAGLEVLDVEHPGGEPTLAALQSLLDRARAFAPDWIAGVGGGSVLDAAKACAALIAEPTPLRALHDGAPIRTAGLPFVAVPTTAGTGSEATIVAVLTNEETGEKKSIRAPSLMARLVVLDPLLLAGCPPPVMAHSGLDALTQAIESALSRHAVWLSETLAVKALALIAPNLEAACGQPASPAGAAMMEGSYLAGLALSLSRLGIVHGLAHPLGARYHAPHGLVCGVCLPLALEFNRPAVEGKYARMSREAGADLLDLAHGLLRRLGVRSPFAGRALTDAAGIVRETLASGSTEANPRPVTEADVRWFLDRLFAR